MILRFPNCLKFAVVTTAFLGAAFGTSFANAGVNWSVGIAVPGVVVSEPAPEYYERAPIYGAPPPVYYQPAPPVYYRQPPVYYRPPPVYYRSPPTYYRPEPAYFSRPARVYDGQDERWREHEHHRRDWTDRD